MIEARPYDTVELFDQACFVFLEKVETLIPRIYTDGVGVPTWGIGFALIIESGDWLVRPQLFDIFDQAGIRFSEEQRTHLNKLLAGCVDGLNRKKPDAAFALIPPWRAGEPADTNPTGSPLLNQDQAYALLKQNLPEYQDLQYGRFVKHLGSTEKARALSNALANSHEAVALLSLTYNAPSLIGPGLTKALFSGNRAEAWFQIRDYSNGSKSPGLAKRRFYEAHQFGLLPFQSAREAEAFQAMYANRKGIIDPYEQAFGDQIPAANRDYALADDPIATLAEIQQQAQAAL